MDAYQAIYERKTIRRFSDQPISNEMVQKIISAGLQAPSNNHMREWHFVLINDINQRKELLEKTIKPVSRKGAVGIVNRWKMTDEIQRKMYVDAIPLQVSMLLNCPRLVIPCFRQTNSLIKPKNLFELNAFASIWCCIENILIAAAAENIYGVTRIPGETEREILKAELALPADYEIPCWLALGYAALDEKRAGQLHIDPLTRIHTNTW
jgi:nitroreductase